jgi:LmbE family N-acetylglucosaminyl deacetylase
MVKTYLFTGAHIDDIEIGAAGLLTKSLTAGIHCYVLVFSDCEEQLGNEGITEEFEKSMKILGVEKANSILYPLPNTKLPSNSEKIRNILESIKRSLQPDLIVTHSIKTLHQDHLTVVENCRRVYRYTSIICYEDLKSTPIFNPNLYVQLNSEELYKKLEAIDIYKTQKRRTYYSVENIKIIAKKRGIDSGTTFAEAYEILRIYYNQLVK